MNTIQMDPIDWTNDFEITKQNREIGCMGKKKHNSQNKINNSDEMIVNSDKTNLF